jgi:hypothetical protein
VFKGDKAFFSSSGLYLNRIHKWRWSPRENMIVNILSWKNGLSVTIARKWVTQCSHKDKMVEGNKRIRVKAFHQELVKTLRLNHSLWRVFLEIIVAQKDQKNIKLEVFIESKAMMTMTWIQGSKTFLVENVKDSHIC